MNRPNLTALAVAGVLSVAVAGSVAAQDASPEASLEPLPAGSPAASMSAATVVPVIVQEVAVVPATTTIPAGSVTLEVTNNGPAFEHEFVVVQTDLPADGLPTNEDGSFDEEGEGVTVLGEIEPFAVGTTESLTLDLPAGHYVFLCNVVTDQDGTPFSHYANGMRVDVEVTEASMSPAPMSPAASAAPSTAPASTEPAASTY